MAGRRRNPPARSRKPPPRPRSDDAGGRGDDRHGNGHSGRNSGRNGGGSGRGKDRGGTPGTLTVIPTPIGNLEDVTYRAVRILGEIGALACEDTRHTRRLLARYDIPRPPVVLSCHGHNEEQATRRILALLADGVDVGLCSDAGTPGLSDPGMRVVAEARAAGFEVDILPGASAAVTGFVAAGLPAATFCFLGFLPRRTARRRRSLEPWRASDAALVIYESPRRIAKLLAEARETLGDREAAVCLELTKVFQRVCRGRLSALEEEFAGGETRGEAVIVIGGAESADPEAPEVPAPEASEVAGTR